MDQLAIDIKDLSKTYVCYAVSVVALKEINIQVKRGERVNFFRINYKLDFKSLNNKDKVRDIKPLQTCNYSSYFSYSRTNFI